MNHPSLWMTLVVAASSAVTSVAHAAIVHWNLNAAVPATTSGLFINLESGATAESAAALEGGWDLNPHGANALYFGGTAAEGPRMMVLPQTGNTTASALSVGTLVGADANFLATPGGAVLFGDGEGLWKNNAYNLFGFQFANSAGQLRYGFGMMFIGANALDRRLITVAYEDSGAGITAVPAPGVVALSVAMGLVRSTRRRR